MKYLLLLSLLPCTSYGATQLINAKIGGKNYLVSEDPASLFVSSPGFEAKLPLKPCSKANLEFFKYRLSAVSRESLNYTQANHLEVKLSGKTLNVSPASPLGKFIEDLDQHMITLKKEMDIACKRK